MNRLTKLALVAIPLALVGLVVYDIVSKKLIYGATPARELTWAAPCDPSNDRKKVALSGHVSLYPRDWGFAFCRTTDCDLALLEAPGGTSGLRVVVPTGSGRSEMSRLTNATTAATLEMKDAKGARVGSLDRVRLVGTLLYIKKTTVPSYCILTAVTSIEKL